MGYNSFKDILDECVVKDYIKNIDRRKYDGIHLSEVGCPREYMFKVLGYPRPLPPPEDIRVLDFGSLIHDYIQKTLVRNGFVKQGDCERPIRSALYEIDSNTDIASININGEDVLIDIKTIKCGKGNFGFDGIKKPIDKHRQQVMLYMHFLNEELRRQNKKEIVRAIVVYVKKCGGTWLFPTEQKYDLLNVGLQNNGINYQIAESHRQIDIKEFTIIYDPIEAKLYENKVAELDRLIKIKVLPPIPDDVDTFACDNFCNYRNLCINCNDDNENSIPKLQLTTTSYEF